MNSTASPFETSYKNYSTAVLVRDTYTKAFMKNLTVVLVWFILSYINVSVVVTFFKNQVFYEDPRYILFIHMVINDAIQLTVTIMLFVLSYIFYFINVSFCCFFMLVAIFTTRNSPLILACMAIERYIAVCNPLRHAQICTAQRTYVLIGLTWFLCLVTETSDLFFTLATESIGFFYTSVFCLRKNVFRAPTLSDKMKALDCVYFLVVFLTLVYTYLRVLFAARALSSERSSAQKARNTIFLHGIQLLMCVLSYIYPSVEAVLSTLFPAQLLDIRYSTYLIVYILPRFLSPIIYGVRDTRFRKYLKRYFVCGLYKVKPTNEDEMGH
ncbi:odorant receptor 131-2-like [Anguilla anguilla]|uniref:odorant receptor 131-2-like n=1 Tax=Anguilla anguilla TaxID=7936 RepID=UPI0015AC89DC|nr:odorant receptor 131-2-like [Anguilla anguilla]XP_035242608.1 odorant receptor 131-2-like [Anguilla anguilla]XP_035242609.1 odorant receptor 131-2-like [Anguilla anguilla]